MKDQVSGVFLTHDIYNNIMVTERTVHMTICANADVR